MLSRELALPWVERLIIGEAAADRLGFLLPVAVELRLARVPAVPDLLARGDHVLHAYDPSRSALPNETVRSLPPGGSRSPWWGPVSYTGGEEFPAQAFPLHVSDGSCTHR